MENFLIFFVMFVTIVAPSLLMLSIFIGVPVVLIRKYCKHGRLDLKTIGLSILFVTIGPILIEILSVGILMVLFHRYGRP